MTALSPLSQKRIIDVLSRYGEVAQLFLASQPDPDAPWQLEDQTDGTPIPIKMLVTTQRLADAETTPDDAALTQALGLLPIDVAMPQRGDRIKATDSNWVIRQILPLKPSIPKAHRYSVRTAQIIQMILNNSGDI